jgi:hypothetical protein
MNARVLYSNENGQTTATYNNLNKYYKHNTEGKRQDLIYNSMIPIKLKPGKTRLFD